MKKIVILGAGFGGVKTALELHKKYRDNSEIEISIVDKNNYQLFLPALYEIATAVEEMTEMMPLKKSITVPLQDIFANTKVKIISAEVLSVNATEKKLETKSGQPINFDYLVIATGSETDYFGIAGAKENSLALKSLTDALMIRNKIEFTIQRYRMDVNKKNIRIIVAGGGYTGCEFAAELGKMLDIIAWKNSYPKEKIEVVILEAMNELIPGLDSRLSDDTYDRLKALGIRIQLSSMIAKVTEGFIELANGEKESFDLLIWTTGVKAKLIPFVGTTEPLDKKERFNTKTCLQLLNHENIFALGDCACIYNPQGRPVPPTAQNAIAQARYIAYALAESIENRTPVPFVPEPHGFIVTLGGKWAILKWGNWYLKGKIGWLARVAADLRYFYRIVGLWKAIQITILQTDLYSRND